MYYLPKYLDRHVNICSFFIIRLFTDYFYLLTSCETVNWTAPLGDALRRLGCDWHGYTDGKLFRDERVKFIVF